MTWRPWGSGFRRSCLAGALALLGACASLPGGRAPEAGPSGAAEESPAPVGQQLFRLVYDGGEGRVGLRVVLRRSGERRFQLAVADVIGRAVFGLDYAGERSVLVDHRARIYCVSGPGLRLSEVHPSELPLVALPRILRNQLPVPVTDLVASGEGGDELVDPLGRRWRAAYDGGSLVQWTLFDEDGPALWWTRQDDGGILSRRGGEQYRWTLIVSEDGASPLGDIVPDDFAEGICGD